jgi:hypothetical protein
VVVFLALALLLGAPPEAYDTVVLDDGGVLRGTVVEDLPGADLVLETPDGLFHVIPRARVAEVRYATAEPQAGPAGEPEAPTEEAGPPLDHVPALQAGVAMGLALPLGRLDGSGLALGSAVTPQITFTFEGSVRPMVELELGAYVLLGVGSSSGPLNDQCLAAGSWCDALDVSAGFFPRWSFLPRGQINPWIMLSGGFEWLSVSNEFHDAFDFTGWQVGAAVGFDLRTGPGLRASFQVGTRWGQFTSLSVSGPLPGLWLTPAMHGWIDLGVRGSFGL